MKTQLDAYRKLILLMLHSKQHMAHVMELKQMTPIQGMLLMLFEPGEGKSMQELTQMMACDASNTTGLIDRLDSHGYITRTTDPNDRRIKIVTLNKSGLQCREEVLLALRQSETADLQKLSYQEQLSFVQIVDKLTS